MNFSEEKSNLRKKKLTKFFLDDISHYSFERLLISGFEPCREVFADDCVVRTYCDDNDCFEVKIEISAINYIKQ